MITLEGKYNKAFVMIDEIDPTTKAQILNFLDCPAFKGRHIVVMPDCHAGVGAVIGFTSNVGDAVIPNVIGVDIGCGVDAYNLGVSEVDFGAFDKYVRKNIPSGFSVRSKDPMEDGTIFYSPFDFMENSVKPICEKIGFNYDRACKSVGTLGGGNHFIELDKGKDSFWLSIHSGSRGFGNEVAKYHQKIAEANFHRIYGKTHEFRFLEWLLGDEAKAYLKDMKVAQEYAELNRETMAYVLCQYFWGFFDSFTRMPYECVSSVHNYINFRDGIIRKGAISAHENEPVVIPLNMMAGVVIGTGKGNDMWNFSAPHGAGRILSRTEAKKTLDLAAFKEEMDAAHVWTSCISKDTLDEAPGAYKDVDVIIQAIEPTVEVQEILKPVYNFKAGGD